MGVGTYIAIYFIFWWITLFLVLPFFGRSQADDGNITLGTVKSAPAHIKIWKIVLMNTILCSLVFGAFYVAAEVFGLTFEDFQSLFPSF